MSDSNASDIAATLRAWFRRDVKAPLARVAGGRERLRTIVLLACVLGLDAADKATVGAVAGELRTALDIGNIGIGWLVTASTAVAAVVTLPFGAIADRVNRSRMLIVAIVIWSGAMVFSGASGSYTMLLISRLALGTVAAAAAPAVVSLTGDFFRPHERGRIFGYVFAGELVGVAFGFLISGNIAALLSWRASFWVLAACGFALAFVIRKCLDEPERGGQGRLPVEDGSDAGSETGDGDNDDGELAQMIERNDVEPARRAMPDQDPSSMSIVAAVRHLLRIRTFRTLVIASSLGYFYFTGLRTFAVVFVRGHFGLGQAAASSVAVGIGMGAIAGVLLAGREGDRLIQKGHVSGRVLVAGLAYLVASAALVPGFLVGSLAVAAPLLFVAAAGIGGANPAVDAARLDVMHWGLWGRAEGVHATLRYALEAIAPPLFGWVSTWFGASGSAFGGEGSQASQATGLGETFLVLLLPLCLAGVILLVAARRTYPGDVAAAIATQDDERRDGESDQNRN